LSSWVPEGLSQTWTGVDLFFVISGFVVSRSLVTFGFKRDQSPSQPLAAIFTFYRRRFWRIAPLALFWSIIPAAVVILFAGYSAVTSPSQISHDLLAILTLRYNYVYAYATQGSLLLSPYWSLCVEEHFYLFLPFLFFLLPKERIRLTVFIFIILLTPVFLRPVIKAWFPPPHPVPYFRGATHCRLDSLFLGVVLSSLNVQFPAASKRLAALISWFCIFGLATVPVWMTSEFSMNWGLMALSILSGVLVVLASHKQDTVLWLPGFTRMLETVGKYSYALYLSHMPAYFLVVALFHLNNRVVSFSEAFLVLSSYAFLLGAFAFASRKWIEEPLRMRGLVLLSKAKPVCT
jgi:peptidoglycan/LPS O-acetylase OafA/YrhL